MGQLPKYKANATARWRGTIVDSTHGWSPNVNFSDTRISPICDEVAIVFHFVSYLLFYELSRDLLGFEFWILCGNIGAFVFIKGVL